MKLYADPVQAQTQSSALRNLMKNAAFGQASQKTNKNFAPSTQTAKPDLVKRLDEVVGARASMFDKDVIPTIGGLDYDVSKEEALDRLKNPLYILDSSAESGGPAVFQENENRLENGLSIEYDLSYLRMDMTGVSSDALRKDIDYISSRYAAMYERINTEFTGEEKETHLKDLEKSIQAATENLAKKFSEEMSGFFDDNGLTNDKDNIYQSVLSEVGKRTAQYVEFAKSNQNYADSIGADEAWLKKDSAYMASELRKAMANADAPKASQATGTYSLDDMENLYVFSKELKSYSDSSSSNQIIAGENSEEALGMKLSELMLKGIVFNEKSGVSDKVKDMVTKSTDRFIKSAIEAEQAFMDKWSSLQIQAVNESLRKGAHSEASAKKTIEEIKKNHTAYSNDTVYAMIEKVASAYEKTGDASKALIEGAVWGKDQFESKTKNEDYKGISRYDSSTSKNYWNTFFSKNAIASNSDTSSGYVKNQSGWENMVNSWNGFMGKITIDSSALLTQSSYTAKA